MLQLRRPGDWYSVWKFFDGQTFRHWYVNLERPFVRREATEKLRGGIDTDDLELDLVIDPDGTRMWKDVEHLHARLEEGRMTESDLRQVLAAAADLTRLLDRDERWWAPWDDWVPPRR